METNKQTFSPEFKDAFKQLKEWTTIDINESSNEDVVVDNFKESCKSLWIAQKFSYVFDETAKMTFLTLEIALLEEVKEAEWDKDWFYKISANIPYNVQSRWNDWCHNIQWENTNWVELILQILWFTQQQKTKYWNWWEIKKPEPTLQKKKPTVKFDDDEIKIEKVKYDDDDDFDWEPLTNPKFSKERISEKLWVTDWFNEKHMMPFLEIIEEEKITVEEFDSLFWQGWFWLWNKIQWNKLGWRDYINWPFKTRLFWDDLEEYDIESATMSLKKFIENNKKSFKK